MVETPAQVLSSIHYAKYQIEQHPWDRDRLEKRVKKLAKQVDQILIVSTPADYGHVDDHVNAFWIFRLNTGRRKAELIARSTLGMTSASLYQWLYKQFPGCYVHFPH